MFLKNFYIIYNIILYNIKKYKKKRKKKKENLPNRLRKKNLPLLGRLLCKNLQKQQFHIPSEYRL